MDQVLVLTYTDRNHKTRVISESEFYEMFVCENNRGRYLNSEEDWLELFDGDFNYISFYRSVINGDINDFQEIAEELNRHWSTRGEKGVDGVYGFVNAGVLDHRLFNEHTFDTEPTDFKIWMEVRKRFWAAAIVAKPEQPTVKPIVVEKTSTYKTKSWLL